MSISDAAPRGGANERPPAGERRAAPRPGSGRGVWRFAFIPIIVWTASLFVAEASYRALGVRLAATMEGFYEAFGNRSFKHRPNASALMNWYSGTFSVHTDSLGFRVAAGAGGETSPAAVEILVLGDSQAFGQGVEVEDSVVGTFAAALKNQGIVVGNAAVGGHFLRNQIEVAKWLVDERGLRPRVVVVALTPRAIADPDGYTTAVVRDGALFSEEPGTLSLVRTWLSAHSAAYIVTRDAIHGRGSGDSAGELLKLYDKTAVDERGAKLGALMRQLAEVVAPSHARVVFVYLPLAVELRLEDVTKKSTHATGQVSARAPYDAAKAVSDALGAPLIDLTPTLRAAADRHEPLTLRGDPHYTQALSRSCGSYLQAALDWASLLHPAATRESGHAP